MNAGELTVLVVVALLMCALVGLLAMSDSRMAETYANDCRAKGGFAVSGIGGRLGCLKELP